MIKRVFSTIVIASLALTSFAGGLLTNTNQSAAFMRNPMRYASLDADAVYFNPAGTAFFKEGWSLSTNWQMIWQQRDVESNNRRYDGKIYVPVMPTIHATYKTGDWAFSAFFGMPGGGGTAEFNDGLPLFDVLGNQFGALSPVFTGAQANGNAYSKFESTQYLFCLQLGAAYKISENLSAYVGLRGNYTNFSYEGNIFLPTAMGVNNPLSLDLTQTGFAVAPVIGLDYKVGKVNIGIKYEFRAVTTVKNDTKMLGIYGINANKGFDEALNTAKNSPYLPYVTAAQAEEYAKGQECTSVDELAYKLAVKNIMETGADQATAISMVNNNSAYVTGAKATVLETVENQIINKAEAGLSQLESLQDGEEFRSDAPAKLSIGASWEVCDRVKLMGGATYYFDKDARIESLLGKTNNMHKLSRNTYELIGGVEVQVTKKLLLSAGCQFSDFGVNKEYLSDISFIDDAFMTAIGGKYSINEDMDFNFGASYTNYAHGVSATSKYLRKTYAVAVGLDFRF